MSYGGLRKMKIFWKCNCGNANKFELKDYFVFTSEQTNQRVGTDYCAKCNREYDFELDLKILDQGNA